MIHAQAQRWHHNTAGAAASASAAVQMATELGYPGLARAASLVLAKVADLSGSRTTPSARLQKVLGEAGADVDVEIRALHQLAPCTSASGSSPTLGASTSRPWRGPRASGRPWSPWGLDARPSPGSPPTSSATGTACSRSPTPRVRRRRPWPRPTCAPSPSTWRPGAGWQRCSSTSPPSARSGSGTARWCSTARPPRSTSTATGASSRRPVTSTTILATLHRLWPGSIMWLRLG